MILYDYVRSSAAYRVRIALNLKGLSYQQIPVNLLQAEQRGEQHRLRNPQGLVPVLEDQAQLFSQSLAICEYLEECYPDRAPLLPGDPINRAKIRGLAQLIACDIHPLNNLRVLGYLVDELKVTEAQKLEWYRHWISEGFNALEQQLVKGTEEGNFCVGTQLTLADICLVPQVFNARRFEVDMASYPRITEIDQACQQLAEFAAAHPDNN